MNMKDINFLVLLHDISGSKIELMPWATGQPANEGDKCVVMSFRVSEDFEWADASCSQPLNFVCEKSKNYGYPQCSFFQILRF